MRKIVLILIILVTIITSSTVVLLINHKSDTTGEDITNKAVNITINKANSQSEYSNEDLDTVSGTEKMLNVPLLCQYPELPTGCEATAAAMVLQYYGINITAEDFARNWLACDANFYSINGIRYGPDPNEVFAGDPFSEYAYGCYATPIVSAVNKNSTQCKAWKITDESLETLCAKYIDEGKPLLIWATMGMKQSEQGNSWYLQNGTEFTWIAGEHCLVLVGYNEDYYFLNDPQTGGTVAYKKEIVELRFQELGSQAVYISKANR